MTIVGCNNNNRDDTVSPPVQSNNRWITLAGALQGKIPGDGNGGTLVYSITLEEAKNPEKEFSIFEKGKGGFSIPSQRTSRISASQEGSVLFTIPYSGDNGGIFQKYQVKGAGAFQAIGNPLNISQYATTSPRWAKLKDGDKTGVAVNISGVKGTYKNGEYQYTRGEAAIVSFDLQKVSVNNNVRYQVPLTPGEEKEGNYIFRFDSPALNKAGNKLILGTWMGKKIPGTENNDKNFAHLASKSVVVDYPSLKNPIVITSGVSNGDTAGYRSVNIFLGDDGNLYQATQRDTKGAHILRIGSDNTYDDSYSFSLDEALGIKGSSVEHWMYVGNGIAYAMYSHKGAASTSFNPEYRQSFLARLDLNAKTATKVDLPYEPDMYFFQYQGFVVNNNDLIIPIAAVGKDGYVYIINKSTGTVTKGAKLKNVGGAQYIGAF
ncbi:MAG: hypothetical protein FDW93_01125 [Bergeyella sp.]|nr:hypothetical protein [Bergeyella sp.]